jgi:hypothetical protein
MTHFDSFYLTIIRFLPPPLSRTSYVGGVIGRINKCELITLFLDSKGATKLDNSPIKSKHRRLI